MQTADNPCSGGSGPGSSEPTEDREVMFLAVGITFISQQKTQVMARHSSTHLQSQLLRGLRQKDQRPRLALVT